MRQVNYYLIQFLIGHKAFLSYLHRMHRADDDRCVYCNEEDTAEHVFFENMCFINAMPFDRSGNYK